MSVSKGQTVYFTTSRDPNQRSGTVQEATSLGYLINGVWYGSNEISIKNVLLDSKNTSKSEQLLFG